MADSKELPTYTKFLFASLAGIGSATACFPLDLLKTRMQVFGEGGKGPNITTYRLAKTIVQKEGVLALYSGLSASIARQATYTGVRLGSFQSLVDYFTENGRPPNLIVKCLCGVVSGTVGGIAGLPADVALTRMAADGNAPPEKRRNYKHIIDALIRICSEEGFFALYRGLGPTVARAAIINIAQLVSYSQTKEVLLKYDLMKENTFCHITSSVVSAFVSTVCVLPADMAKTRIQNMTIVNGKGEYSGMIDVWIKIVTREGVFSLWKGFTPLFIRNGPQFTIFFVIYENLFLIYKRFIFEKKKT